MKNNTLLLMIASGLILFGILKPDISRYLPNDSTNSCVVENFVVDAPKDSLLLEKASLVRDIIAKGSSSRNNDGKKLSSLYYDLATLVDLRGKDEVVRNTEEIRQANSLAGMMLQLGIKDKYDNLAKTTEDLLVAHIGKDDILLDETIRNKAVEAFRALSWACYEGSK